ncbi:hypothetical protein EMCRGX_G028765 [Ephydatia muelleri]
MSLATRQLYYACLIGAGGDGPLQQCGCLSLLTSSEICTSFNKSNTAFGAGLISVGTKELSSEQQGHTGVDAATRSTAQLVQAS